MLPPQQSRNRIVQNCGWVLLGGLAVWLTTGNVSAWKPRQAVAGPKANGNVKPVDAKATAAAAEREKVFRKLRAIAQQMVKVATADWRVGKANAAQLFSATRRLGRIDIALAKTKVEKLAAIDAYVKNLKGLQKIAEQLYRSGKAPQGDVLSIHYAVTEAELWKLDVK